MPGIQAVIDFELPPSDPASCRLEHYTFGPPVAEAALAPFRDPDSGICVAADARLDNLRELEGTLGFDRRDHPSPSRLIARGYERWGAELPARLLGDFAFVVWDERKRELFAARDPFGVRPLFYHRQGARVFFASEAERVLAEAGLAPRPEPTVVLDYLMEERTRLRETPHVGVFRVAPGHWARAGRGEWREKRYWFPPTETLRFVGRADMIAEFRDLLAQAVKCRLDDAGPTLIEMSGGLDSPSIACLADGAAQGRSADSVATISAVCPGLPCDESRWIDLVAQKIKLPSLRWDATQSRWNGSSLSTINYSQAEPQFAGYGGYYSLLAERGARTIISGIGADQLIYEEAALADLARRGRFVRLYREALSYSNSSAPMRRRLLRDAIRNGAPASARRLYRMLRPAAPPAPPPDWLGQELLPLFSSMRKSAQENPSEFNFSSILQRATWNRLAAPRMAWNIEGLQIEAGRLGRAIRFPYLDRRLAEFVLALPYGLRLPGGWTKRLLREAMGEMLPRGVAWRVESTTYESLVLHHVRQNFGKILEALSGSVWLLEPYVNRGKALDLLKSIAPGGETPYSWKPARTLWAIAKLENWLSSTGRDPNSDI